MDSLRGLMEEVNPGLSTEGIDELLSFYSETFAADWAPTKPNVFGIEFTNRGYTRLDNHQYLQPNTKIGPFTISVDGPTVEFWVDYDRTGWISHYGRLIRTNLFNQRAGWAWTSKSPPQVAQSRQRTTKKEGLVLISVEDGSKHYYCLNAFS